MLTDPSCYYYGENPSNGRYYHAYIIQDLLEDWIVVTLRGNNHWHKSIQKKYVCLSYKAALKQLAKIKQIRQQHGYQS